MNPKAEYKKIKLDEVRCPDCGNENGLTKQEAANKHTQPVPPQYKMNCPECDANGPVAKWHGEYKWHRMSEEERKEARKQREKAIDKMAEYQSSAHYQSLQREP
jgi:uncharacterized protein with PIN domain